MMKRLIILMLAVVSAHAAADSSLTGWRTSRPIFVPTLAATGSVYLPLDESALAGVDSLSEYRIIASGGLETPYRMIEENGQTESYPLEAREISHSEPGRERVEAVFDTGPRPRSRIQIDIELASAKLQALATVDGSADMASWTRIVKQNRVYRLADGVEKSGLDLPAQDYRYLRITLKRLSGTLTHTPPVRIASVVRIPKTWLPVTAKWTRRESAWDHSTVLEVDLGKSTRDITEAKLDIAERAFDRAVTVEVSRSGKEWDPYTAGASVKRLEKGGEATIALQIPQARKLRIGILNGDDPPLTIKGVSVYRFRRGLMFAATPTRSYELRYRNHDAPAPNYELARLPLTVTPAVLAQASLGMEKTVAPSWSERNPVYFWGAFGGVVLLLFLVILRSMRGMNIGHSPPSASAHIR